MSIRLAIATLTLSIVACSGGQKPPLWEEPDPVAKDQTDRGAPVAEPAEDATAVPGEPAISRRDTPTLLLEGTPEISASLRKRLSQYLSTRGAGLSDLSANGKQLLISTRFAETRQIHLISKPMGVRRQLTFREEPSGGASFVPGDKNAILFTGDVGGDEKDQIYRLDLTTGRATMLTDGKSRNGDALWSWDGKQLAYRSNARNGVDFDIWLSDGEKPGSARRLVDATGWYQPLDWSRDGKKLLVGEYISANEQRIHLVDVAKKSVELITPKSPKAAYASAHFSANGKRVYVTSDHEGEFIELYELQLKSGTWRPLTRHIPWNVEAIALSVDGRTLAFTTNENGFSVLRLLSTASRKEKRVSGLPRGVIGGLQFARKANVLGFSLASSTQTGDVYTYNLWQKKLSRWSESEIGGLSRAGLNAPKLIHYKSFDGAQIPALYYKPQGIGPFPVVIAVHGGPEGQARPRFSALTQFMTSEEKVAVIYPNVRGSTGYGKSYLALDNGFKREDSVKDVGALLDWIASQPELDAGKIGIIGGSYGGYMVLSSLVHYGDRIIAGVDVVGISNFVTFLENTGDYRRDLRRAEYGDERDPKMRAHLEKISPLNNVDRIKSALFVAQGANDPRVPASEAEQIVTAVRKAGHNVWYMLARNEGHGFGKKENRDIYTLLAVMFFAEYLK